MPSFSSHNSLSPTGFSQGSPALQELELKSSPGGAHISRTIMLAELELVLAFVPMGAPGSEYRSAIPDSNVLGKTTVSTRQKSLRHLRELYAVDGTVPIFGALRKLHALDSASLPLLAVLVVWSRDSLFRATSLAVLEASEGDLITPSTLAQTVAAAFPGQYSELNQNKVARNAASSWTQSGNLLGRSKKTRHRVQPTPVAATLAFFLGQATGFHGVTVFSIPWCRLLDLDAERARSLSERNFVSGIGAGEGGVGHGGGGVDRGLIFCATITLV